MPLSNDDKGLLDGIILCAHQSKLSLMQVRHRTKKQPVLLLCCDFGTDDNIHIVPVAEMIVGNELSSIYDFPNGFKALIMEVDIEVGTPGVDKP